MGEVRNECRCCGRVFTAAYSDNDENCRILAEECDVCPKCSVARLDTITGIIHNVTGKRQLEKE